MCHTSFFCNLCWTSSWNACATVSPTPKKPPVAMLMLSTYARLFPIDLAKEKREKNRKQYCNIYLYIFIYVLFIYLIFVLHILKKLQSALFCELSKVANRSNIPSVDLFKFFNCHETKKHSTSFLKVVKFMSYRDMIIYLHISSDLGLKKLVLPVMYTQLSILIVFLMCSTCV